MNVCKSPRSKEAISLGVSVLIVIALILIAGFGIWVTLTGINPGVPMIITSPPTSSSTLSVTTTPSGVGEYQVTFAQIAACKAFPPAFWGIPWAVTIDNTTEVQPPGTPLPLDNQGPVQGTYYPSFSNITFTLPEGTYSYFVSPTSEFFTPDSGNVTVAGSNVIVPIQYSGTSCTETLTTSQSANTSTVTNATTSTISTVSTSCSITGQGAIELRILADSNSSPVVGARIYATNNPDICNGSPAASKTLIAFTTNGTVWYSLPSENIGGYAFIVSYSGQNYTLSAGIRPVSMTCATLYIPSGHTNVTITEFDMNC